MTNIALVVLDTLRRDAFEEHFGWHPGVRFDNAWSPGAWTTPAHAALFGGAYPSELGVYAKTEMFDCERPSLAEQLADSGYTTRGFSANANISSAFDFDRGFSEFRHSWRGNKYRDDIFDWDNFVATTQDQGPSRFLRAVYECVVADVDTVASLTYGARMKARDLGFERISGADDGASLALEQIRDTDFGDDEFYFLNLMEAHGPYNPPKSYQTTDYTSSPNIGDTIGDGPAESGATIRQAYDDCVRYLSDVYADIFAELRADFDYVVTMSDHGELFGESGVWAHDHGIYPELVNVPLCIYDGREDIDRRSDPVSSIDVHRTILDIAGVDGESNGRNVLESPLDREILVERFGLRSNRIEQMPENGHDQATIDRYDTHLFGIVVPERFYGFETLDRFESRGELDGDVDPEMLLAERREDLDTVSVSLDDGSVPEDVQARLEELGYA